MGRQGGPFIKYIGGGDWRIFVGVMKLVGPKIFLKIFDKPQNIFFCASSRIFLVTSFKKLSGSEHKMFKLAVKEI